MSVLFPAYFLGFLGLALPWMLHRFSDQQPPEHLFPSKQFLESTTPPVSRKRLLRYKALLCLRVLSLIFLCALFAQPWISRNHLNVTGQLHHIIAIDQSLSMRAGTRWEAAVDRADELIAQLAGSGVDLVAFDQQVRVVATTDTTVAGSQNSLTGALRDLQAGYSSADYGVLIQRLDRLAAEKELPVKLWLISDMQQSALPAQLNALYAPNISQMELLQIASQEQSNVHLIANARSDNGATASVSVSLIASNGSRADEAVIRSVQISSGDTVLDLREVSLLPGELTSFTVDDIALPESVRPGLTVRLLEPDALAVDNELVLPILSPSPTRVVLLRSEQTPVDSATVFMTTALETDGAAAIQTLSGTVQQVPSDAAHLVTARDLSSDMDIGLLQFIDAGNNVLVTSENRSSTSSDTPVNLQGTVIGSINDAHPLALGDVDWTGTEFYAVPQFELRDNDEPLVQLADGTPLLVERVTNRGRLLILNDPLDGVASNLPFQPAFVGLMQNVVRYFDASTSVPDLVIVGERLALPANVQLIDGNANSMVELSEQSQSSSVEITEPGIYTVVNARGERQIRAVIDSAEADIRHIDSDAISAWQARYETSTESDTGQSRDVQRAGLDPLELLTNSDPNRQALWHWLLPLIVLLFIAESWFANRRLNVRRDGS